jgi:hypothetical protein
VPEAIRRKPLFIGSTAAASAARDTGFAAATCGSMSRTGGNRFSQKIMFKQRDEIMIDSI